MKYLFSLLWQKIEACVDVSEWYYRMFQKNLKLRTNIVVGTVPLQNYQTPQETVDVTEAFSFHPHCATVTKEYADDTSWLKSTESEETVESSLLCKYTPPCYTIHSCCMLNCRYLLKLPDDGLHCSSVSQCKYSWTVRKLCHGVRLYLVIASSV